MNIPLQDQVVYGPVASRRFGVSLGINVLPIDCKFCLLNCIYCQYGWTNRKAMRKAKLPSTDFLMDEIRDNFEKLSSEAREINAITFCGNGEPTFHPELGTILNATKHLRDRYFPRTKIGVLSDSSRVHLKGIRDVLKEFDECYMKWDAGSEEVYHHLNRPLAPNNWKKMLNGLKLLPSVILQSLFIEGPVNNSVGERYQNWLETIEEIHPKEVFAYTLDRPPADPRVKAVPVNRLMKIQEEVKQKLGISVSIYD